MELVSTRQRYRGRLGTDPVQATMIFALRPTQYTQMALSCGLTSLAAPSVLWPGDHLKIAFKVISFSGELDCLLRMQVEMQDPFPGVWVLHHLAFAHLLVFRIGIVFLECITEPIHYIDVSLICLNFRPTADFVS